MTTDCCIELWGRDNPHYKKHPEDLVHWDHPTLKGIATKFNKEFGTELIVRVVSYDHPNTYKVMGNPTFIKDGRLQDTSKAMSYEQTLEYFRDLRKEYREVTPRDKDNLAALKGVVDEINEEFRILCSVEFVPGRGFHVPGPRIIGGEIVGSEYMTYEETMGFLHDLREDYRKIIADNRKHVQQVFDFEKSKSCNKKKEEDMPADKMSLDALVKTTREAKLQVTVSIPVLAILSNSNVEVADAVSERLEEALEGIVRDRDKPEPIPTHDIEVTIHSGLKF